MPNNIDISGMRLDTAKYPTPESPHQVSLLIGINYGGGVSGFNVVCKVQTIFLRKLKMVWNWVLEIFWKFWGVSVCSCTIVQNQGMRKLRVT